MVYLFIQNYVLNTEEQNSISKDLWTLMLPEIPFQQF